MTFEQAYRRLEEKFLNGLRKTINAGSSRAYSCRTSNRQAPWTMSFSEWNPPWAVG